MLALRHAFARLGGAGERVTLDDRHALEVIREHARGEQAGDAPADHHGVAERTQTRSSRVLGRGHDLSFAWFGSCTMRGWYGAARCHAVTAITDRDLTGPERLDA
jgi:hypothetical protein